MTSPAAATSTNSIMNTYLQQQAKNVAADQAAAASGANSTSSNSLANATSATTIGSNFNTFIKILTTQLQHQDPTNATDPNQFTQELVQFAGVEQQLNTNNDLQSLINLQKNSGGTAASLGYMGQYVESTVSNSDGSASGGGLALQSGASEFGYTLPSAASSVTITVKDSTGNTVATMSGPTTASTNYVSWNGQDSSGNQLADGAYTFSVSATDSSGKAITPSDFRTLGKVTGVTSNSDGSTNLALGIGDVKTSTIDAIYGTASTGLPSATALTA
jgi:flagellar basal-body rod modification protein FlgD